MKQKCYHFDGIFVNDYSGNFQNYIDEAIKEHLHFCFKIIVIKIVSVTYQSGVQYNDIMILFQIFPFN